MAERDAAVHAAAALLLERLVVGQLEVLLVVVHPLVGVALVEADPVDAQERAQLAHQAGAPSSLPRVRCAASVRQLGQRALVVARHHLDERAPQNRPSCRAARSATGEPVRSACSAISARTSSRSSGCRCLELDQLHVAAPGEAAVDVEHVGDAAAHAGGEVAGRSGRSRRRARRSCTRSRGRRRPRRPCGRPSCGPRSARRRGRGRTPCRPSPRRGRCCRRSRSSSAAKLASGAGRTTTMPPDSPLPT